MLKNFLVALTLVSLASTSALAEIKRFMRVSENVFRGTQPETLGDYYKLQALGVRTIVNLRSLGSVARERRIAKALGMTFIHAPISSISTILLAPPRASVERALAALNDTRNGPVFVHCKAGKDRTGYIVGLYRVFTQNWEPEDAYIEMRKMGFSRIFLGLSDSFWARTGARPGAFDFDDDSDLDLDEALGV